MTPEKAEQQAREIVNAGVVAWKQGKGHHHAYCGPITTALLASYEEGKKEGEGRVKLLTYGDGLLQTQQGEVEGMRCLTIRKLESPMPINAQPKEWDKQSKADEHECILAFRNIAGARTLQDELNELIAKWSREQGLVMEFPSARAVLEKGGAK